MRRRRGALNERGAFERRQRDRDWPLPVLGWHGDAGDVEVDPRHAALLENLWWSGGRLEQRPGFSLADNRVAIQRITHALTGGDPQTLLVFPSYVEANGAQVARSSNGRWMTASMSHATIMVDGAGDILRFNGTTLDKPVFTAGGEDVSTFDGVLAHHDRLYFWRSGGDLSFWYADVLGGVEGGLTKFPLGRLGNIEGGIAAMGRFTSDAGDNANDLLVILTTTGHVVIYQGTDPGLTDTWRIWGRLKLAPPVSRFALVNFGPDLLVLTTEGIASIGEAMNRGSLALVRPMSEPIRRDLAATIAANPDPAKWQMIADPAQRFLLLMTPGGYAAVFGLERGAWYRWTGLDALQWRHFAGDLRFNGLNGRDYRLGGDSDAGAAIRSTWWSGWTRAVGPHVARLKPLIRCVGDLVLSVAVLADHADTDRDVAEHEQTVTLPVEHSDILAAQMHDEPVIVSVTGEALQLRLSFEARGANIAAVRWSG